MESWGRSTFRSLVSVIAGIKRLSTKVLWVCRLMPNYVERSMADASHEVVIVGGW